MNNNTLQDDFLEVVENNKKLIYKVSHMYCDSVIDKKDLFQEIVLNLWRSFPTFNGNSKASTWVYRVALNTAITWYRNYQKNSSRLTYINLMPVLQVEAENSYDELYNQLYNAINTLGKVDKAIMLLLLDEYSYDGIAEIVGLTKTNVATKIGRIKLKLRSYLTNN